ncbi:MAG: Glycosyl transferase, group 1 family protein [Parcubacteria group bacterium GW2011_GWB1_41_6]|nr:MAG: Glycosyl transferase, group 1 family protein [Parcubacteria group bacterium GW2011_GWB1_41_6]
MALKKLFFLIIVLSFIIPLAYSFYFRIHPSVDARAYDNIAYNLASGRGYRESLDIPLDKILPRKEIKKFKVLYVAYTNPRKGLSYLLDAWESLDLPLAELILVGKYVGMPEEMIRYCDEIINRNPSIKWVGGTQDPWQYYQDASVFVLPSLSECYGKVTLEAMASGVPVIVSENARAIVEDGKTGFVVPIRDAKAIKEKIEYLYHNREIAEKMGREARKAVENKKSFGEEVFEIYQEILKREGK